MKQQQSMKTISAVIVVLIIFGSVYVLSRKSPDLTQKESPAYTNTFNSESKIVTVKNTPMVKGVLPLPAGFPTDVPVEGSGIIESATTDFPSEHTRQFYVSFKSSMTVAQKYAEYKDYMQTSGYKVTEGSTGTDRKNISGIKGEVNLVVSVKNSGGKAVVDLSYLVKSL